MKYRCRPPWPGPCSSEETPCQTPFALPQLRLGEFAFQSSAVSEWPTGGLTFHLRRTRNDRFSQSSPVESPAGRVDRGKTRVSAGRQRMPAAGRRRRS